MEPIIIFNEKYYPVMDDYTDEKGITKKAPFIQIGETMVRVVQPRKVGDKFWQHLQGSDVKVKKKIYLIAPATPENILNSINK